MIPLDLLAACKQMYQADRECWQALEKLAPSHHVLPPRRPRDVGRARQKMLKGVQKALADLAERYRSFLAALGRSSATDEERRWHRKDVRRRYAAQWNFVKTTFRIEPPIETFEDIEAAYWQEEAYRARITAYTTPPPREMRIAAVWGRIEQDWLRQDDRTGANIDWLRQLLAEQDG